MAGSRSFSRSQARTEPRRYRTRRPTLTDGGPVPSWRQRRRDRTDVCSIRAVVCSSSSSSASSGMARTLPRATLSPAMMATTDREWQRVAASWYPPAGPGRRLRVHQGAAGAAARARYRRSHGVLLHRLRGAAGRRGAGQSPARSPSPTVSRPAWYERAHGPVDAPLLDQAARGISRSTPRSRLGRWLVPGTPARRAGAR